MLSNSYAIFSETSNLHSSKKMISGANLRVFNNIEVQQGEDIAISEDGTTIYLHRGCYHISAVSVVNYVDDVDDDGKSESMTVPTRKNSNGGYCLLIKEGTLPDTQSDASDALAIGTASHASTIPSLIDTILVVEDETNIQLMHQVGDVDNENVYLTVSDGQSTTRVFSRMTVIKLS